MVGRPKSDYEKSHIFRREKEALIDHAVDLYRNQPPAPSKDHKGYRIIACECSAAWNVANQAKFGFKLSLSFTTVQARNEGRASLSQTRAQDALLTRDEDIMLTSFLKETARRGFPCNVKRIREAAVAIFKRRRPDFTELNLGKSWHTRFLQRKKANKELASYWSRPLKTVRASVVNPHTHKQYFDLLEDLFEKYKFEPDCIYGMDESCFMKGVAEKEVVFGEYGKKVQHEIREVDRENTTVICTICADGTSVPPFVIFKATGYQVKWLEQDNPLKASLGYQVKGWTNSEQGIKWAEDFNRHTKAKARGRPRLLAADGHSTHYTFEFLSYCLQEGIQVVCYPSNSTHIYQGLDVACFGIMKARWAEECRKFEGETGCGVTKENFLEVFGRAYVRAFTRPTIQSAFSKTGLWPLDRTQIPAEAFAPSLNSSTSASSVDVPMLRSSSPVQHIISLLDNVNPDEVIFSSSPSRLSPAPFQIDPRLQSEGAVLASRVAQRGNGFLFTTSLIKSENPLRTPPRLLGLGAQASPRAKALVKREPRNDVEHNMQESLMAAHRREDLRAMELNAEQSKAVQQLKHKEKRKQKNTGKIKLTGNAIHLMAEEMVKEAKAARDSKDAKDRAAEARKKLKASTDVLRKAWKQKDDARKERNRVSRAAHKASVEAWQQEKKRCQLTKTPLLLSKPKKFNTEKEAPKEWLAKDSEMQDGRGEDDVEMGNDDGEDEEMGSDGAMSE